MNKPLQHNGISIEYLHSLFLKYPRVSTDTRNIPEDSLFFALKGDNFDGHKFVDQALSMKAEYAIIDKPGFAVEGKTLLVEDVLETLQKLARYHRDYLAIPVIALTGTNGKTTSKELIREVLSRKYKVSATIGNLNNHIGVPLTLLSMDSETEIGLVEMGANHPGEIALLCEIARPNYGLITNVGKAHLEGFGSYAKILETKTELFRAIQSDQGKLFLNASNKDLAKEVGSYPVFSYGVERNTADVWGVVEKTFPVLVVNVLLKDNPRKFRIETKLFGEYNLENILAAFRVGLALDVEIPDIIRAIEAYVPGNNRSQLMNSEANTIIIDAYNANPTSMSLAIDHFAKSDWENKVFVLGDMFELGDFSYKEHLNIQKQLIRLGVEDVYLAGRAFCQLPHYRKFKYFETTDSLYDYIHENTLLGKTVLLKASRGMRFEKLIDVL